jgi:drug/metabolite transporter (DMT)-like permease
MTPRPDDPATAPPSRHGRLLVLAAAVLWSTSGVVTKGLDLPPTPIAIYRSLFAGLVLLPLVPRARRVFRPSMLPTSLIFGAMIGTYIAAVKYTTAANAIFLQCTASVWLVPLGFVLLGERADRRTLAGITLAGLGIVAIVGWGYDPARPGEQTGILLGLASGLAFACVVVSLRHLRDIDPLWLSALNNLGGALALGAWTLATTGSIPGPGSLPSALALAAFGALQMAVPYALFAAGLRGVGAAEAGLLGLLEPVLNPVWVVLVHGERPAGPTLVGGALLLAGVALRFAGAGRRGMTPPKRASPIDRSEV